MRKFEFQKIQQRSSIMCNIENLFFLSITAMIFAAPNKLGIIGDQITILEHFRAKFCEKCTFRAIFWRNTKIFFSLIPGSLLDLLLPELKSIHTTQAFRWDDLPQMSVGLEDAPEVGAARYTVLQHTHRHLQHGKSLSIFAGNARLSRLRYCYVVSAPACPHPAPAPWEILR